MTPTKKLSFKNDRYRNVRGGHSRFLKYKKENRPAICLYVDAIVKKIISSNGAKMCDV